MPKEGRGRPQEKVKDGPGYRMAAWLNDNLDTLTNMTNEELADKLGYVRPNIISMWRTGRTRVPLDRLPKLADILGVSLAHLLVLWMDQYTEGSDYTRLMKILSKAVSDDEALLVEAVRGYTKGRSFDVNKAEAKKLIPQIVTVHR